MAIDEIASGAIEGATSTLTSKAGAIWSGLSPAGKILTVGATTGAAAVGVDVAGLMDVDGAFLNLFELADFPEEGVEALVKITNEKLNTYATVINGVVADATLGNEEKVAKLTKIFSDISADFKAALADGSLRIDDDKLQTALDALAQDYEGHTGVKTAVANVKETLGQIENLVGTPSEAAFAEQVKKPFDDAYDAYSVSPSSEKWAAVEEAREEYSKWHAECAEALKHITTLEGQFENLTAEAKKPIPTTAAESPETESLGVEEKTPGTG